MSALPAWCSSYLSLTDGGLGGRAKRAMTGLSVGVGILSGVLASALMHAEDAGFASYNIMLWGYPKVGRGLGGKEEEKEAGTGVYKCRVKACVVSSKRAKSYVKMSRSCCEDVEKLQLYSSYPELNPR